MVGFTSIRHSHCDVLGTPFFVLFLRVKSQWNIFCGYTIYLKLHYLKYIKHTISTKKKSKNWLFLGGFSHISRFKLFRIYLVLASDMSKYRIPQNEYTYTSVNPKKDCRAIIVGSPSVTLNPHSEKTGERHHWFEGVNKEKEKRFQVIGNPKREIWYKHEINDWWDDVFSKMY